MSDSQPLVIYTVGHSNLRGEELLRHLQEHGIEVLVDVRTRPRSRFPQFNQAALQRALEAAGIRYEFAGETLGGRPPDPALQTPDGGPDYDRMAVSEPYRAAIDALLDEAQSARIAIMCSEGDPEMCHREKLIAPSLRERGAEVRHILRDGSLGPAQPKDPVEFGSVPTPAPISVTRREGATSKRVEGGK